jgi:hypothetical protein
MIQMKFNFSASPPESQLLSHQRALFGAEFNARWQIHQFFNPNGNDCAAVRILNVDFFFFS